MSNLPQSTKEILIDLKNAYQQIQDPSTPPDELMTALNAINIESSSLEDLWHIYSAYSNYTESHHQTPSDAFSVISNGLHAFTNLFYNTHSNETEYRQQHFFEVLGRFSSLGPIKILDNIQKTGLLTGEHAQINFYAIVRHRNPLSVIRALYGNERFVVGEYGQDNFDAISKHPNPGSVRAALYSIERNPFFTGDNARLNRTAVINHKFPEKIADGLAWLQKQGLLTGEHAQANFNAVVTHQHPLVGQTFWSWVNQHLFTGEHAQVNFNTVIKHQNPWAVSQALCHFRVLPFLAGEDGQVNRDIVTGHQKPWKVSMSLCYLQRSGLLTGEQAQANFNTVVGLLDPSSVALEFLEKAGILTGDNAQANFNAVVRVQNPQHVARLMQKIINMNFMMNFIGWQTEKNQTQFNQLMSYSNILFAEDTGPLWDEIPKRIFTEEVLNRIFQICRANQVNPVVGRAHLSNYINIELLGMREGQRQHFNRAQSTHTASVHQTVSESATRLEEMYGEEIDDLTERLGEIHTWVCSITDHEHEKRAIKQLVNSRYEFKDPASGVTTKILLVLSWIAIHDDSMRIGTLEDAKALLLEGLLDIQRAYNLNDAFEDRGGRDKTSCASGTFNKIIEKLVGVHPYVEMKYITKQGAMLKLKPLIIEAATYYLRKESHEDLTVELLKKNILPIVREQLFFEYGESTLAELTKNHESFEDFKASSNYTPFQKSLENEQDTGLELMISYKLSCPDEELDEELKILITSAVNEPKEVPDETSDKPATRKGLRAKRLAFFDPQESQDNQINTVQHAGAESHIANINI